jgi:UDP-2,3-diacylglucosamine pyrophosphatase LpxH
MGDARSYEPPAPYGHPYYWLSEGRVRLLANFLEEEILNASDVKNLVILGDLFDNWVCPVGLPPASFQEIINTNQNKEVIEKLKQIASHDEIELHYVPGNHDMTVEKDLIADNFPGIHFWWDQDQKYIGTYKSNGVVAEHGNRFNLFCAPNPGHPNNHWLPIGFFISRAAAEKKARHNSKTDPLDILDNFVHEFLDKPEFIKDLFTAIAKDCGLNENTPIKMNSIDNYTNDPTVKDVVNNYAGLPERWDSLQPAGLKSSSAISNQLSGLRLTGLNKYCPPNRIVIFGHTHKVMLIGMSKNSHFYTDDGNGCGYIYANSGTWVDGKKCTYIEVDPEGSRTSIRLYKYSDKGKKKRIKSRYIYT